MMRRPTTGVADLMDRYFFTAGVPPADLEREAAAPRPAFADLVRVQVRVAKEHACTGEERKFDYDWFSSVFKPDDYVKFRPRGCVQATIEDSARMAVHVLLPDYIDAVSDARIAAGGAALDAQEKAQAKVSGTEYLSICIRYRIHPLIQTLWDEVKGALPKAQTDAERREERETFPSYFSTMVDLRLMIDKHAGATGTELDLLRDHTNGFKESMDPATVFMIGLPLIKDVPTRLAIAEALFTEGFQKAKAMFNVVVAVDIAPEDAKLNIERIVQTMPETLIPLNNPAALAYNRRAIASAPPVADHVSGGRAPWARAIHGGRAWAAEPRVHRAPTEDPVLAMAQKIEDLISRGDQLPLTGGGFMPVSYDASGNAGIDTTELETFFRENHDKLAWLKQAIEYLYHKAGIHGRRIRAIALKIKRKAEISGAGFVGLDLSPVSAFIGHNENAVAPIGAGFLEFAKAWADAKQRQTPANTFPSAQSTPQAPQGLLTNGQAGGRRGNRRNGDAPSNPFQQVAPPPFLGHPQHHQQQPFLHMYQDQHLQQQQPPQQRPPQHHQQHQQHQPQQSQQPQPHQQPQPQPQPQQSDGNF